MSSTPAVLEATDVWAGYGGPPVLAGVDLTLRPGEAVGLLGRSGVGKSTLVEILGGGQRPTQGHVTFDGAPVAKTPRRRRKDVRARLRTVHQNGIAGVDVQRTVEETILDAFKEARKAGRTTDNDVEAALAVVALPIRFVTRRVGTLSGGERQRVAIARALATRPDLLLLDEPLTAVEQTLREEVADEIRALVRKDGIGLLVASHDLRLLERLTEHVLVLAEGTIVESGPLRSVLQDPQHPDTRALVEALPDVAAGRPPR
ncbi:ABC transporter related protein [Cellulomonas flavigena DSM 20109]|uniref:ABC transporter related protein n=1 Tax=Cellulomonas flavigena (strain ATCC 482 / DSM 20109 / BCRC 11376 / JCM 18109 / NBRC 3775 / NCIMB 8073 / NRS 134) TaxID=446466 RepID=D5UL24_CELFN|nr:ATP-binding cassette domain-containing protein [Cellulomonas flavigena]ADG75906.1 ABC transporter related protein [Cellulomonas flavigena DSM 20109]